MTRRGGLGRGLDALLGPETAPQAAPVAGQQSEVGVDLIDANRRQPRASFDDASLEELARSISALGVLQPLLVRPAGGGRYELVAGERRLRAARRAGVERVPVLVVETDDRGSLERALVENLHREDLNPIEEAAAYRALLEDGGLTQEALAVRLGRARATVANSLRLLELPVSVQELIAAGRLSGAHGKALMGLDGSPFLERLARRVAEEALSVRATEDLVRRYREMVGSGTGARPRARPPEAAEAQRRLADGLQTRVRVEVGKRKGRVVVDFSSLEELERLTAIMLGERPPAEPSVVRLD
ncbi:MAG TPA: ParB/RepB/Spo0J family partition protein [Actinomycetota bacterium]|nr:ParB/RepB/Spo0J family partition protein [Actinomycetota bacterium]